MKWKVRTDDNDDGGIGSGLYIDDIFVYAIKAFHRDVGVGEIATNPINLNQNVLFTIKLMNYGLDDQSDVPAYYRIISSELDTVALGVLAPWASIDAGEFAFKIITWRPTIPGDYTFECWTGLTADEDPANDTLRYSFNVPEAEYIELGFDDGMIDLYVDTLGSFMYVGGDTVLGAGIGVRFVAPGYDSLTLIQVKTYLGNSAPFAIHVYRDEDGPGTEIGEPVLVEPTIWGEYSSHDVNYPIEPDQAFFVALINTTSEMAVVGIDLTAPHERNTWSYSPAVGWNSLASSPRYRNIDLMLRAVLYRPTTGTTDRNPGKPIFYLGNNYPNPFNPVTTISYSIPECDFVKLEVFNLVGERVSTLVSERKKAGNYVVRFDASELPTGIYFYKLQAGERTLTKKMLLMK